MNASPLLMGVIKGAITFAIVMVAITMSLPNGWGAWHRLQQSGLTAHGTVVSCEGSGKGRRMSYMYSVDGRDYTGMGTGCEGVGHEVDVVFLPDEPAIASLKSFQDRVKWLMLAAVGMGAMSGFAGAWVARKRAARVMR